MKFTYLLSVHCSGTSKKFSPRADFMWVYMLKMLWLILREKISLTTVKSKCVVLYFHEDHSSSEFCGELGTAKKEKLTLTASSILWRTSILIIKLIEGLFLVQGALKQLLEILLANIFSKYFLNFFYKYFKATIFSLIFFYYQDHSQKMMGDCIIVLGGG